LIAAALAGAILFWFLPPAWSDNTRLLVAWDAGVIIYLTVVWSMAARSSTGKM